MSAAHMDRCFYTPNLVSTNHLTCCCHHNVHHLISAEVAIQHQPDAFTGLVGLLASKANAQLIARQAYHQALEAAAPSIPGIKYRSP